MLDSNAWSLNSLPSSGCRGGTVCAVRDQQSCRMKGESTNWERMREISNDLYYFTHDIICAKGTAFVLTQNWGNHWKKHFTHILWVFSNGCDDSSLISLRGVSCQPARLGIGKWCLGRSTCTLSLNDSYLSVWFYYVTIKQGRAEFLGFLETVSSFLKPLPQCHVPELLVYVFDDHIFMQFY